MANDFDEMRVFKTSRNFHGLNCETYQNERGRFSRLIQESSAVGDYHDSFDKPGSSFLWVGDNAHLSREGVTELIRALQWWLDHGCLKEFEVSENCR